MSTGRWQRRGGRTGAREGFSLRPARTSDLEALVRFEEEVFAGEPHRLSRRRWRHLLERATGQTVIAEAGGELAGVLVVTHRSGGRSLRIYSLGVHPRFRRRGLGRRLLTRAADYARRRGLGRIRLEVRRENRAAVRLYRQGGFRPTARLPNYYGLGEDALRMELRLEGRPGGRS